ncbi:DUF2793 domain-containing protein [Octadecabacter ascidiaceicola]|uniref:DUF2793 domain-containing protein n=1 Tax=Octadecabacter ascidiaceicola TaxID=1655543 RepID=A0A238JQ09_9RHOB|nr:DUF2793 domain-containing protein [Octadecabacter ascidiaceicola]SMX32750.1 hypothetical protein OCA8868_00809 [Octadecabacter ascidiaceicola]
MSDQSPILSMPYIQPAQAQKHVTHNEALFLLDAVVQLAVEDATLSAPPASPAPNARYIVGGSATGDWAGNENSVALYTNGAWTFFVPIAGWHADILSTGATLRFDGTDWVSPVSAPIQNVDHAGINATADDTNRLTVAADATLLTNVGDGHQLKVNKAAPADTASLLFQTGYSGRAEMGTTGTDDFAIKVSDDGATYRDAIVVEADTGAVQMPQGQCYLEDVFIMNDTSFNMPIPFSDPARILMWLSVNIIGRFYLFSITGNLSGANNFGSMFVSPPGSLNFLSGPLNGTTGPASSINVSVDSTTATKRLFIENRLGSNRLFTLSTMGK